MAAVDTGLRRCDDNSSAYPDSDEGTGDFNDDDADPAQLSDDAVNGRRRRPGPRAAVTGRGGALETTTVRLLKFRSICSAPQFVADELLRAEGFSDVRYVDAASSAEFNEAIASGRADFTAHYASPLVAGIDGGGAIRS